MYSSLNVPAFICRSVIPKSVHATDQVRTASSSTVLHHDPQVRALQERPEVTRDVIAVQLSEDLDLLLDVVDFIFCALQVNDLDGDRQCRSAVISGVSFDLGTVQ